MSHLTQNVKDPDRIISNFVRDLGTQVAVRRSVFQCAGILLHVIYDLVQNYERWSLPGCLAMIGPNQGFLTVDNKIIFPYTTALSLPVLTPIQRDRECSQNGIPIPSSARPVHLPKWAEQVWWLCSPVDVSRPRTSDDSQCRAHHSP